MSSILTEIILGIQERARWRHTQQIPNNTQRRMCREFNSHRDYIWYSGACALETYPTIPNEGCVVSSILTEILLGIKERARWRRYEWL